MVSSGNLRGAVCLVALVAACPAALMPGAAQAQAAVPPATADTTRLSDALRLLARNPQSFDALVAAGEASLRVDDVDAALGFFRRAETLQPQDARTKAGIAAVMVRQRQPLEALRLFAEAAQGGGLSIAHVADRGLAYDLIGDNARAQQDYQVALAAGPDPVVTRRLALSLAITGDQRSSEATLLPLLQTQDLAAYRTRAFMLAIVGKGEEAVSIAQTMLPASLSGRMAPYLRYMPRLTRAQQAAAANLGAFPPAGDIGRDDPALAAYAASIGVAGPVRTADARLVPSGAPLGRPVASSPTQQAPPARPAVRAASTPPPAPVQVAVAAPVSTPGRTPMATPAPAAVLPERARAMAEQHPEREIAAVQRPSAPALAPVTVAMSDPQAIRVAPQQEPPAALTPAPIFSPPPAAASFTAAVEPVATPAPPQAVVVAKLEETAAQPAAVAPPVEPPPRPISLSEAFADLRAAPAATPVSSSTNAVDITRIQPRRETATPPKPAAPPKPPPVPSRQWVQVATGRDSKALAFDWRRIKREADGLLDKQTPSTADWGQTNRLVVGPFATTAAADQLIAKLKDKKLNAFRFTSAVGEAVTALP